MELWDTDAIDLVAPGFIEFDHDGTGRFGFRSSMRCTRSTAARRASCQASTTW